MSQILKPFLLINLTSNIEHEIVTPDPLLPLKLKFHCNALQVIKIFNCSNNSNCNFIGLNTIVSDSNLSIYCFFTPEAVKSYYNLYRDLNFDGIIIKPIHGSFTFRHYKQFDYTYNNEKSILNFSFKYLSNISDLIPCLEIYSFQRLSISIPYKFINNSIFYKNHIEFYNLCKTYLIHLIGVKRLISQHNALPWRFCFTTEHINNNIINSNNSLSKNQIECSLMSKISPKKSYLNQDDIVQSSTSFVTNSSLEISKNENKLKRTHSESSFYDENTRKKQKLVNSSLKTKLFGNFKEYSKSFPSNDSSFIE